MRLHPEPFERIKKGIKDIEYRVNDEKRRTIQIGDVITFYKRPEERESLTVVVKDLKYYDSLLEMFTATFERDFKDRYHSPEDVVADTPYYSDEEVKKYGCVAIYFDLLKK